MSSSLQVEVDRFMDGLRSNNPHQPEFQQAVHEVCESVMPLVLDDERFRHAKILERMAEPDRIITFRVCWEDDHGDVHVNRAFRVQFNNSIGPYKGGLRFHPTVNKSVLKFLGFEQVFKNALTGLPMGGAKGGANFDPKGKSDREVMRFCHALMTELHRHIGEDTDIPAGDIGVGAREIGYLFGQYKRCENRFVGTMTGKGLTFGGSLVRKEATGYGTVYFAQHMLARRGDGLHGKNVVISGSGNVAIYAAEKAIELGGKVIALSDSGGFIHDADGVNAEKLAFVKELKEERRGRIREYCDRYPNAKFHAGVAPWGVPCEVALPCATQNELDADAAKTLIGNGVLAVSEGANMPSTAEAVTVFRDNRVLFGPGKAANAGGVAVSGLEQSQNSLRLAWGREEVDQRLQGIMTEIHETCVQHGQDGDHVDYVTGANRAGFVKVAEAMLSYGVM